MAEIERESGVEIGGASAGASDPFELEGLSPVPFILLEPVRGDDGAVVDFLRARANGAAEGLFAKHGVPRHARLLEVVPGARASGLFDGLVRCAEAGGRVDVESPFGPNLARVHCSGRAWRRYVALWVREVEPRAAEAHAVEALERLVEAAPVGLALFDSERRCVRANGALAELAGVAPGSLRGAWTAPLPPPLRDIERALRQVLDKRAPDACSFEAYGRAWEAILHPVLDAAGAIVAVSLVVLEATERRRTEAELRGAAEMRDRLIGVVSHDLRNPLNAIVLSAQRMLRMSGLPEAAMRASHRVITSAERMNRLVGELLDSTRGRLDGGIPVTRRSGDLFAIAREVLEELRASHPEQSLVAEMLGDGRGEWDLERMGQVLSNLVGNALNYGDGGSVEVVLDGTGQDVVCRVHNGGTPIPAALLPVLFEPFRRGVNGEQRRGEGLGLGLFIVRHIVMAHGGRISVASSEAEGTTFTMVLPRRAGSAA